MTSDIARARRKRARADRRGRLARWAADLSWHITVTWPAGFFGWLLKWVMFATPVGLLLLATWMQKQWREVTTLLLGVVMIALLGLGCEYGALRLGAGGTLATMAFFLPFAILLAIAIRRAANEPEDDQPEDDPEDLAS